MAEKSEDFLKKNADGARFLFFNTTYKYKNLISLAKLNVLCFESLISLENANVYR